MPETGAGTGYPENTYIDIPSPRNDSDPSASEPPAPGAFTRQATTGTFGIDPIGRSPEQPPPDREPERAEPDVLDVSSAFDPEPWAPEPAGGTAAFSPWPERADVPGGPDHEELPQVHLMPPGGPGGTAGGGERSGMSRTVKIGAAAAALVVLATGTVVGVNMTSGDDPETGQVAAAQRQADPKLTAAQKAAADAQRRKQVSDAAARAGRDAFRKRPDLKVKVNPKPSPEGGGAEGGVPAAGPVVSGSPRAIARKMLPRFGFASSQFGCLDRLWERESSWNPRAANPSGAYGIPQALPGSKMSSAGSDWETNPATQIEWGLGYIKDRYSTPCGAWSHFQANGSY